MGKIKLSDVVSDLLVEMDKTIHDFNRLETIAISVLRLLNLDVLGNIKTEVLEVTSNKKAYLPKGYVNYIKIGVLNSDGEIATFTRNQNLSLNQCGSQPRVQEVDDRYYNYNDYNITSNARNVYFGHGSDVNIGSFNIDNLDGSIVFEPDFPYSEVVCEHLSSEIDIEGEYFVDERLEEALKAGTYFFAIRRLKTTGRSDKRDAEIDWTKAKRQGKSRINPFRVSEANDISRRSIKLAIKA